MSKTVDERVVSMQFDNKQFESNVQTSLSTLDKLKKSLNFDGASKGFEKIDSSSRKIDFSTLSSGVETIRTKFSALEVMAVTALANITNSAVNAGKRLISSFTIEPIKTGFQEYETQINAVQTILANTSSKGTTLEDVNKALDELNTYADKTIYNFTEMTRNIGTFTAAGIDLKTSTAAIQGIANLAAVSGSTSQQASTAMYQLSQALSSGTVKLQDWNSVVTAGMGGQVFQDALKKTAEAHGVNVDKMIKKNGSFRESLKEGWITSEILTETLSKMTKSGAAEYLSELTGIEQSQIEAAQETVAANKDGTASYEKLAEKLAETGKVSKEDALEILKMADTAEDAATKVKTFTQLLDTLKEAAQSGWTQTWEILVGDFDEAKELWTQVSDYFSEVIGKSAEARNNMLEGWAKGGGREMAIESIKNAFNGLLSIISPIKEAFREIFPPMTSEKLLKITETIRDLTEKFKLNSDQQEKLKTAFKGLFSIVDIGATFISKLVSGIFKLIGSLSGAGDGILNAAGSLGDWLLGIRDSIKETDIFGKAIDGIVGFLQKGIEKIKEFYGFLKEKIELTNFEWFFNLLCGIWDFVTKIGSKIGEIFSGIGKGLASAFNSGDLSKGLDLVNGGLLAAVLLNLKSLISDGGIKDALQNLMHPIESIKETLKPMTSVLDGIKGCLQAWQSDIKANTILKIAGAIAILVASLVLLSALDQNKLQSSIFAITALFADLMGAMSIFGKFNTLSVGVSKAAIIMISMAIAVNILAGAVKKLASLEIDEIVRSVSGISVLTFIITKAAESLSKVEGKAMQGALNMILFAAAINILASACKSLANLNFEELVKGLSGTVILMYVLSECSKKLSGSKGLLSAGVGMIAFATALKILSSSVKDLSSMNFEELVKGLSSTVILLFVISECAKKLSNTKGLVSAGIGMIAISAAVKILSSAVASLGTLKLETIGKGLLALAGSLTAIVIATKLMPKNIMSIGLGLLIVSSAISILSKSLSKMGSMSLDSIGNSLIALGGSLVILAVGLHAMNGTMGGSAALLIAATALNILAPAIIKLGSISLSEIGKAILSIAAAFAVMGIAGALLAPVVPAILGLSASLALIGIAAAGIGAGLFLIASGLTALAVSGTAGATAIVASLTIIITGLLSLIPVIITHIGNAIIAFCEVIINSVPAICEALIVVINGICNVLMECAPTIIETALTLLDTLLQSLAEHTPSIIQAGIDILLALLQGISSNISQIATEAVNIITSFLDAIGEKAPELVSAGIELVVNLIDGLAQGIVDNAEAIHDAMVNLVCSLIEAFCALLGIHSPSTVFAEYGANIIEGLVNGIVGLITKPVEIIVGLAGNLISAIGGAIGGFLSAGKDFIVNIGKGIAEQAGDLIHGAKTVVSDTVSAIGEFGSNFLSKGKDLMTSLGNGIKNKASEVISGAKSVVSGAISSVGNAAKKFFGVGESADEHFSDGFLSKIKDAANSAETVSTSVLDTIREKIPSFSEVGTNMMDGLKGGIKNAASSVVEGAKGVVSSALQAAKNLLGIKSPSREFKKIGMYVDEGFVIGLNKYKDKVEDASADVGQSSIKGLSDAISSISEISDNDMNLQPVIRPVIDLDNVNNGIGYIDDMLSKNRMLGVSSNIDSISSTMSNRQNGSNADIVSAINKLDKRLSDVGNTTYTINGITYDDGSNVSDAVRTLIRAAKVEGRM